ncbi:MAG: HEAT repeat domain-containing protein [Deltaproteobacteria bacterium]|nr:HEAT repeat domain-containing protein [Deltaproteobacteria bacterium]
MLRRITILTATLCLAGAARADDRKSLSPRGKVELALSAIEEVPSRAALERLHPNVELLLHEIVARPSPTRRLARNRALTVLRLFPSATTRRVLQAVVVGTRVDRPGMELLDLQQATSSFAVVAGPEALPVLAPLLDHAQLDVRRAAAESLRLCRSPKARALLERRLRREPSALVRHELKEQLGRMAR